MKNNSNISNNMKQKNATPVNNLKSLLDAFFKAIQEAYPGKTINLTQPITNCYSFGDNSDALYLYATLDNEQVINLYASDPEEIEENGLCTNTLNTELGTIIIAEDF